MKEKYVIRKCKQATLLLTQYEESLPDRGIAEALIFNTYIALTVEKSKETIENILVLLIQYLSTYSDDRFEINKVAKHVTERMAYYGEIWESIVQDPDNYDLKPLYCAFYRFPFTDIHYAAAEPKNPNSFRDIVSRMIEKSQKESIIESILKVFQG